MAFGLATGGCSARRAGPAAARRDASRRRPWTPCALWRRPAGAAHAATRAPRRSRRANHARDGRQSPDRATSPALDLSRTGSRPDARWPSRTRPRTARPPAPDHAAAAAAGGVGGSGSPSRASPPSSPAAAAKPRATTPWRSGGSAATRLALQGPHRGRGRQGRPQPHAPLASPQGGPPPTQGRHARTRPRLRRLAAHGDRPTPKPKPSSRRRGASSSRGTRRGRTALQAARQEAQGARSWGEKGQYYLAESQYQRGKLVAAHDSFEVLKNDYPGTEFNEQLIAREFAIAQTWLAQSDPKAPRGEVALVRPPQRPVAPHRHTGQRDPGPRPRAPPQPLRPACRRRRASASPTMYMGNKDYETAALYYDQLISDHPKSPLPANGPARRPSTRG